MDAEGNDPASNLEIPEGYTVERLEDGRLAIYCASTGAWLGHFSPSLSIVQEVVKDLIDVHEEEEERKEVLSDLIVDPPFLEEATEDQGESALRVPERELMTPTTDAPEARDAADTVRVDALRIRELEIVAGLAVKALRETGDEATAEVIRQVLESDS